VLVVAAAICAIVGYHSPKQSAFYCVAIVLICVALLF
jgi:hypothetical protein